MIRQTIALLALAALGGCAANAEFGAPNSTQRMTATQLAAFAASTEYPANQTGRNDLMAAAIVDRGDKEIKVYNFSNQPIRDARLWVNRSFVARIEGIAPLSKAVIKGDRFYDKMGNSYAKQSVEVSQVELQTAEGLYNLMGPVTED